MFFAFEKLTRWSSDQYFIVAGGDRRYHELIEILQKKDIPVEFVDGSTTTIFDKVDQKLQCGFCQLIFESEWAAEKHKRDYHFRCNNCRSEFSTQDLLNEHKKQQLSCRFCPYIIFCSQQDKNKHILELHPKCNCGCTLYYIDVYAYSEHINQVFLKCLFGCNIQKKTQKEFVDHYIKEHKDPQPYHCEYLNCFKTCKSAQGLQSHNKMKHHIYQTKF